MGLKINKKNVRRVVGWGLAASSLWPLGEATAIGFERMGTTATMLVNSEESAVFKEAELADNDLKDRQSPRLTAGFVMLAAGITVLVTRRRPQEVQQEIEIASPLVPEVSAIEVAEQIIREEDAKYVYLKDLDADFPDYVDTDPTSEAHPSTGPLGLTEEI